MSLQMLGPLAVAELTVDDTARDVEDLPVGKYVLLSTTDVYVLQCSPGDLAEADATTGWLIKANTYVEFEVISAKSGCLKYKRYAINGAMRLNRSDSINEVA